MSGTKIAGRAGVYIAAVVLAVYSAFPIYWMIASSLRPTQEMLMNPTLIPTKITFDYYYSLLAQTDYPRQFLNSLVVALATVLTPNQFECELLNVLLQAMPTASMDGCALNFGALDVLLPP